DLREDPPGRRIDGLEGRARSRSGALPVDEHPPVEGAQGCRAGIRHPASVLVSAGGHLGKTIVYLRSDSGGAHRMRTVATYLTSRRNLAGSGLALLAAALLMIDPVGPQGILLVMGFYLAGVVAVRGTPKFHRLGFDPMHVQRCLSAEIAAVAGRVPTDIWIRIQRIELTIRAEILPRLDCLPLGAPELYLVERTASDFLPTAVETYLQLPGGYASSAGPPTRSWSTSSTCSRPRCGGSPRPSTAPTWTVCWHSTDSSRIASDGWTYQDDVGRRKTGRIEIGSNLQTPKASRSSRMKGSTKPITTSMPPMTATNACPAVANDCPSPLRSHRLGCT